MNNEQLQNYLTVFRPVRGLEEKIRNMPITEGYLYFTTDTGKIFIDKDNKRIPLGGNGISVLYGQDTEIIDNLDDTYDLHISSLEDPQATPKADDLIINIDGKFYRIISTDAENNRMLCKIIAVSGSNSGGGGGSGNDQHITLEMIKAPNLSYIYGQSSNIEAKATAEKDQQVTIKYEIFGTEGQYNAKVHRVVSGSIDSLDLGLLLFKGLNKITITAIGENSGTATLSYSRRNVIVMALLESPSFYPLLPIEFDKDQPESGTALIECTPIGPANKTIEVFVDGQKINTYTGINEDNQKYIVSIPQQTHGAHTVSLSMSVAFEGEIVTAESLVYELAWIEKQAQEPVIWLGNFKNTITNYDSCSISYMAYDPSAGYTQPMDIELLKNGVVIANLSVYANKKQYLIQPIIDYQEGINHYALRCKSTIKTFDITVLPSSKDLSTISTGALMLLSTDGRSNNESAAVRNIWNFDAKRNDTSAVEHRQVLLNDFNWFNNGWILDDEGHSCLKISNGASVRIPFEPLSLNIENDYTFELRFKIRSVQDYSTLISNTMQYKLIDGTWKNESEMTESDETQKNDYGYPIVRVVKNIDTSKGVCVSWLDGKKGLAVGTQEAYFNTGAEVVSARYKENKIITLSFVVSKATGLLSIYLNGILTSVIKMTNSFSVQNSFIDINSRYCDFDLYNLRIYKTQLDFSQIVQNYIADKRDVSLYDQNQIYSFKNGIPKLDLTKIIKYNIENPMNPTMPYMIVETEEEDDRLPYFKGDKKKATVTFVNPSLDNAYLRNDIDQETYLHYCPSFFAQSTELNVQGTSSQGYPKRNYKCKFMNNPEKNWVTKCTTKVKKNLSDDNLSQEIPLKKWHLDNPTCETKSFCWKIDYMESSGSYNSGLADLLGLSYAKHPMEYYNFPGVDSSNYRTTVYGFPVMTFQKHHGPKADPENPYEFIGLYNFNLDKSSNEYYGFEEEVEQPFVIDEHGKHPLIKDVAECWELRNNQGTYTSYKYPQSAINPETGKGNFNYINSEGKFEIANHFEYRYNNEEDAMDMAYDYTLNEEEELADGSKITFHSKGEAVNYLIKKHKNFGIMFDWVASTDTETATNQPLEHPVTWTIDIQYRGYKEKDSNIIYPYLDENGQKIIADDNWKGEVIVESVEKTFNTDTAEYRLQKFAHEFSKHFNKDYCLTYWLITELLLLYDSRGKNCMMATWGPTEIGGEYIWFPIFYDMDTQLGINNSGIPTWEYDVDASLSKTFSSPSSVLWINIEKVFKKDLQNYYQLMRTGNKDVVKKALSLNNIVGAYNRDPQVFDRSYAMKGVRPMMAFNAGEYVKYLNIMTEGYYDIGGELKKDNGAWLYIIQGDRELSRELFLTNRLNYVDSWLGAVSYNPYGATGDRSVWLRMNANNGLKTSDKYLDTSFSGEPLPPYEKRPYPVKDYDATPEFSITPFLKQYVSVGYDDLYTVPEKFIETSVTPKAPGNVEQAFKTTDTNGSQLVYLPGAEYIASIGNLGVKYIDEFHFNTAIRCKELLLGSDVPDYFNDLLGTQTSSLMLDDSFYDSEGKENSKRKALLNKVILTGIRWLKDTIDLTGSDKLEEFRALNTMITGAMFAIGAPLNTLHLPRTIQQLKLIETPNLTKMITQSSSIGNTHPYTGVEVLDSEGEYKEHSTYEGLYIEGLTDLQDDGSHSGETNLEEIKIIGNSLGNNSYTLLQKLTNIKLRTHTKLGIELQNVLWTPYSLVEKGANYDSSAVYVKLTEHYTFKPYEKITQDQWEKDIENELIYINNYASKIDGVLIDKSPEQSIVTDLSLLDAYIKDFSASGEQQFTNLEHSVKRTIPLISGNLYVNNEVPIKEVDIKNKYNNFQHFPKLNIVVKNIIPAQSARFIERDETGKVHILGSQKIEKDKQWFENPFTSDNPDINIKPTRIHYDFIGWKIISPAIEEEIILNEQNWDNFNFNNPTFNDTDTFIFEAIYKIHEYNVIFMNDNHEISTLKVPYNTIISKYPTDIPYKDDSKLKLEETYDFYGYGLKPEDENPISKDYKVISDIKLYALFKIKNVRDAIHEDWFTYFPYEYNENSVLTVEDSTNYSKKGLLAMPKFNITGKVTIPAFHENQPIIAIGGFGNEGRFEEMAKTKVTHVFVLSNNELVVLADYVFSGTTTLKYFDFEHAHVRCIGTYAFRQAPLEVYNLGSEVIVVKMAAFYIAFAASQPITLQIPGTIKEMKGNCFNYLQLPGGCRVRIGDQDHPSSIDMSKPTLSSRQYIKFAMNPDSKFESITFYSTRYSLPTDSLGLGDNEAPIQLADCFAGAAINLNIRH